MFWQNKKNFDFSSLTYDSRNTVAASLKYLKLQDHGTFKIYFITELLYGSESWRLTQGLEQKLQVFEYKSPGHPMELAA